MIEKVQFTVFVAKKLFVDFYADLETYLGSTIVNFDIKINLETTS